MTEATNRSTLSASAGPADDSTKPYSSVSYWAIGGFLLAVAYATVMTVGVVIALFNRMPWILPLWTLVFPLAAALVCWAARVRIHNSEGSLTGVALTVWGLWLSLSFGLIYGAYNSACYLSVTRQATAFADGWFDNLKKDEIDLAYLKTLPPPRPAADANLRARLELDHDSGPEGKGAFTDFRESQPVRQMEQGGSADQVQFVSVQSWGYDKGGYQVELVYRMTNPALTSEFVATVVGMDNVDESGAREWYVKNIRQNGSPVFTDEGRRMKQLNEEARAFAQNWLNDIHHWDWDKAYLDTLPPAVREEEDKKPRGKKFEAGLKAFRQGDIVRADPAKFWASSKEKIISAVHGLFGKDKDATITLRPALPVFRHDGDQVSFRYDAVILLPPEYGVQGQLVVTANTPKGDPTPGDWRIESLDLYSGKTLTPGAVGPAGSPARMPARPH